MSVDLDRLRELAREPERTAMSRSQQFPSMTSEVLRQKQEISALRRGLLEAITEIESLYAETLPVFTRRMIGEMTDFGETIPPGQQ